MEHIYDMLIVGGGPAGYTAALYAARAGLDVLLLEKMYAGGQMIQTTQIDNYPGFPEGIDGYTLGEQMKRQAERFGAKTEFGEVRGAELSGKVKKLQTDAGDFYGRTLVIATGADHKHLGVPGEAELLGRGAAYCAACDGMFYRGKTVAVVGGGNSAAADALLLSRICEKVILIHRRDSLRAEKIYLDQLRNAPNVEFLWDTRVQQLLGEEKLYGLELQNVKTGELSRLEADGVFISIGRKPVSGLFAGQLELDDSGYILAEESTQTSLPGVYAVGDVRTKVLRQVITAAADGAVAVHYAQSYLTQADISR